MPTIGPRGSAGDSGASDNGNVTPMQNTALRVTGWFILGLAILPPIVVILWRFATMPW
jgi:hypothetical protein